MMLTLLKGKLHRATVTGSALNYEGSITIDATLMEKAGILPYEQVDVLNVHNGARFTTYAIEGVAGDRGITVNGAAARLVQTGDLVIICAFCSVDAEEATAWKPKVILLDERNMPKDAAHG